MKVNLNIDKKIEVNVINKWVPYLNDIIEIKNETTKKLICLLLEYSYPNINKPIEHLGTIDLHLFNHNCEESYNILLGKKDYLLENGKTASYYTETILGGIELFLMIFDNTDLIEKHYPYELEIIRDKKIDTILNE
jgi:hypothetical protein